MTGRDAEIEAVMAEYAAAVRDKAPDRLVALYASDVRVFDTWETWSHDGREAWSRSVHDWLGSLGTEVVEVRFDDVRIEHQGEAVLLSATGAYSAVDSTGAVLRSMQNRLSWFLTRTAGRWLIVHEHTSAPIAFEGQKAILHRG